VTDAGGDHRFKVAMAGVAGHADVRSIAASGSLQHTSQAPVVFEIVLTDGTSHKGTVNFAQI
jgi:hypothetical protein